MNIQKIKLTDIIAQHTETGDKHVIYLNEGALLGITTRVDLKEYNSVNLRLPFNISNFQKLRYGGTYSLWKDGRLYKVHGIVIDNVTNEPNVLYQALYGDGEYYIRPYEMFASVVDPNRQSDNKTNQTYRFEIVE